MDKSKIRNLQENILSEPTTKELRPYIVSYIKELTEKAAALSNHDLLGLPGQSIASDICVAIAWQGADGVGGDDWITPKDEPLLYRIGNVTSPLDVDANNPKKWRELFAIVEQL